MSSQTLHRLAAVYVFIVGGGCRLPSEEAPSSELLAQGSVLPIPKALLDAEPPCLSTQLVAFIGSSEPVGNIDSWALLLPSREQAEALRDENTRGMQAAVERAAQQLVRAFSIDPACSEGTTVEITLLSIVDGPKRADSRIETHVFGYVDDAILGRRWRPLGQDSWQPSGATSYRRRTTPFELDMTKDVAPIVSAFAGSTPRTLLQAPVVLGNEVVTSSILYILKTHGGRLATSPALRPDGAAYPHLSQAETWSKTQGALFFDTQGPDLSTLTSEIYSPAFATDEFLPQATLEGDPDGTTVSGTAGDPDGTASPAAGLVAGNGKGVLFLSALAAPDDPSLAAPPKGIISIGAAAMYATPRVQSHGLTHLTLPVGRDRGAPTLVIADACFGSAEILDALGDKQGPAVAVGNPHPLLFDFLNYGALDAGAFLKLPKLFFRLANEGPATDSEREFLTAIQHGTFDSGTANLPDEAQYKSLFLWARPH